LPVWNFLGLHSLAQKIESFVKLTDRHCTRDDHERDRPAIQHNTNTSDT